MRTIIALACALAACQPVASGNEAQGDQSGSSADPAQTVAGSGEGPEAQVAQSVSALMGEAEMYGEACAKYGPNDPNDDSCAKQKTAETKLKKQFNVCVAQTEYYSFEPCS